MVKQLSAIALATGLMFAAAQAATAAIITFDELAGADRKYKLHPQLDLFSREPPTSGSAPPARP